MKITNEMIHKILSKFNFLFNMKYKTDMNTTLSSTSYYPSQSTYNDSECFEIITSPPNIKVESNGELYYVSNLIQCSSEIAFELKEFYDSFLLFYQKLSNRLFIIRTKSDFIANISKCFTTKSKVLLKFIKQLWSSIQLHYPNIDRISNDLIERYELNLFNINKRSYNEDDFELHKAVFEGNLRLIRKICANESIDSHIYCDINEIDSHGNTPLILAIMLENYDVIQVLCDHEADVNIKSYKDSLSAIEYALELQDKKMLKILLNGKSKLKMSKWEKNKNQILNLIKLIPDFTLDLKLNFDSNILSVFSSLTACDYYKISKGNSDMRIDMNISSINNLKGQTSILIKEKEKKVYKIDHQLKLCYDYIDHLFSSKEKEDKINKLLKEGITYTRVYAHNVEFLPIDAPKQKILNYNCQLYQSKGFVNIEKEIFKPSQQRDKDKDKDRENSILIKKKEYKSFKEYFNKGLEKLSEREQQLTKTSRSVYQQPIKDQKRDYNAEYIQTEYESNTIDKKFNANASARGSYIKIKKKKIDMSAYFCKDFPLTLAHFLPLVHILGFASHEFSQLESTIISNKILPFNVFPLKINFPLGMSFQALLSVVGFSSIKPPESVFELNYHNASSSTSPYQKTLEPLIFNSNEFYDNYYKEKNIQANHNDAIDYNNDNYNNDQDQDSYEAESFNHMREGFLSGKEEDSEYNKHTNIICLSQRKQMDNFDQSHRMNTEIPKEESSNPFSRLNIISIPTTPKRSRRPGNKPDLERQKTIKCNVPLKLPRELLLYRQSTIATAKAIRESKKEGNPIVVNKQSKANDNNGSKSNNKSFHCLGF